MDVKEGGQLNLLDDHVHSEAFFSHLLNKLCGWNLENINKTRKNNPGFDLIDVDNKILIQVTGTNSKEKIKDTLSNAIFKEYSEYTLKFVIIGTDAKDLKNKNYDMPYDIFFNSAVDI